VCIIRTQYFYAVSFNLCQSLITWIYSCHGNGLTIVTITTDGHHCRHDRVCYENSSRWVAGGKWRSAGILSVILLPRMSNEPMQQLKLHLCMLSSNWQRLQDDQYMCITVLAPPTLTGVIIVKIVSIIHEILRYYSIQACTHTSYSSPLAFPTEKFLFYNCSSNVCQ